jgi:hypothetical protein
MEAVYTPWNIGKSVADYKTSTSQETALFTSTENMKSYIIFFDLFQEQITSF